MVEHSFRTCLEKCGKLGRIGLDIAYVERGVPEYLTQLIAYLTSLNLDLRIRVLHITPKRRFNSLTDEDLLYGKILDLTEKKFSGEISEAELREETKKLLINANLEFNDGEKPVPKNLVIILDDYYDSGLTLEQVYRNLIKFGYREEVIYYVIAGPEPINHISFRKNKFN